MPSKVIADSEHSTVDEEEDPPRLLDLLLHSRSDDSLLFGGQLLCFLLLLLSLFFAHTTPTTARVNPREATHDGDGGKMWQASGHDDDDDGWAGGRRREASGRHFLSSSSSSATHAKLAAIPRKRQDVGEGTLLLYNSFPQDHFSLAGRRKKCHFLSTLLTRCQQKYRRRRRRRPRRGRNERRGGRIRGPSPVAELNLVKASSGKQASLKWRHHPSERKKEMRNGPLG